MMATVSELSMYQASAMKLAQENQARDEPNPTPYTLHPTPYTLTLHPDPNPTP